MATAETVAMTLGEIEDLAFRALLKAGTGTANARAVARSSAAAHADGVASHGLPYVPIYCEHVRCGRVKGAAAPVVSQPRPAALVVDAGNGFAHPAIDAGFERLVPLAREQGIACLAIRNSYNCGVLGWHSFRLAQQGLLAIGFTKSPAAIAPAGGARKVVGTNPFTVAPPDVASASTAMKNWPVAGGPPTVPENGLAWMPRVAPAAAAANNSTMSPTPKPL